MGHALMENRNGLVVDACLTEANGHAERIAALHMIEPRADRPRPITLGADKAYDAEDFVNELRSMNATPHVAQNTSGRSSAIDGRTTRHRATRSASASASGSKKPSAGSRRSPARSEPSSAAASASDGPSPSQPPPTIWRGCQSSWRPRVKRPGELPTDRPVADLRGRHLGSRLPRSERPGDAHDHRARRRDRFRRHGSRPRGRIRRDRSASAGQDPTKATRSRAKATAELLDDGIHRRSTSPTTTATKPSSKRNGDFFNSLLVLLCHKHLRG